jgi:translation initiation factor 2B subunit (eIF-2B alpha/beta/delta family)
MHEVSMVISGAEVILENGSILNRTGTSSLALIAYSNNKPFYVFA